MEKQANENIVGSITINILKPNDEEFEFHVIPSLKGKHLKMLLLEGYIGESLFLDCVKEHLKSKEKGQGNGEAN